MLGQRVYVYQDEDGTVYYSFTRKLRTNTPARMTLQGRLGIHIVNFLTHLRQRAERLRRQELVVTDVER